MGDFSHSMIVMLTTTIATGSSQPKQRSGVSGLPSRGTGPFFGVTGGVGISASSPPDGDVGRQISLVGSTLVPLQLAQRYKQAWLKQNPASPFLPCISPSR